MFNMMLMAHCNGQHCRVARKNPPPPHIPSSPCHPSPQTRARPPVGGVIVDYTVHPTLCLQCYLLASHLDVQMTKRRRSRKQLVVEDAANNALAAPSRPQPLLGDTNSAEPSDTPHAVAIANSNAAADVAKPKTSKRKRAAMSRESPGLDTAVAGDEPMPLVTPKRKPASKKGKAAAASQEAEATPAEAVAAAVEAVISDDGGRANRKVKKQRVKASEVAVNTEVELLDSQVKGTSFLCWVATTSMFLQRCCCTCVTATLAFAHSCNYSMSRNPQVQMACFVQC